MYACNRLQYLNIVQLKLQRRDEKETNTKQKINDFNTTWERERKKYEIKSTIFKKFIILLPNYANKSQSFLYACSFVAISSPFYRSIFAKRRLETSLRNWRIFLWKMDVHLNCVAFLPSSIFSQNVSLTCCCFFFPIERHTHTHFIRNSKVNLIETTDNDISSEIIMIPIHLFLQAHFILFCN